VTDEYWKWTVLELTRAIRSKDISCREVTQSCLARIDAVNPYLNAIVDYFPDDALAAADRADDAVRRGEDLGALHGVPVTIKINTDYAGRPTTNGVVAFKDLIAAYDSPPVSNWKKAGAVVVGRTNVPAFSTRYFTDNDLHGRTLNPWHPGITPGGSTGGGASAVAAGMGTLAHGSDRAGSIRYPAYACGVFGIRPTLGRVPSFNGTAKAERMLSSQITAVQGLLARSIGDLRVGLHAMAMRDPRDPWWVPVRDEVSGPESSGPVRVAMLTGLPGAKVAPEVVTAVREAARWLEDAGYRVDEVSPPRLEEAARLFFALVMTEEISGPQSAIDRFGDHAVRQARGATLTYASRLDAAGYIEALSRRASILRDMTLFLEQYPLLLMPVSWKLPVPIDADQQGEKAVHAMLDAHHPMVGISILGLPGLAAPTGLAGGAPVGVQIVAGRFREELCFAAGEVIEARTPIRTPIDPLREPAASGTATRG